MTTAAENVAGLVEELRRFALHDGRSTDTHVAMCAAIHRAADALTAQAAELAEVRPYREELLKIAADVGEPDDPFAAWEGAQALTASPSPAASPASPSGVRDKLADLIDEVAEVRGEHISDHAVLQNADEIADAILKRFPSLASDATPAPTRRDDPFRPAVDVDADDDYYPSREED